MGCSDFLEESSQDEVRPTTLEDLMQVMVGEAYPLENCLTTYVDLLTDDVMCNGASGVEQLESKVEKGRPIFSWSVEMFEDLKGTTGLDSWEIFYQKIMGCNVVLDNLDKMTGDDLKRENMRGQALILRGYYYLQLVNLFALPYNEGDPKQNLGVPLKLVMEVTDEFMPRNTVFEVYERIEKDLLEGVRLLQQNKIKTSLYKVNHLVGEALLSRMYLYMENWDEALKYAQLVLDEKPTLVPLAGFADLGFQAEQGLYLAPNNGEVIWQYSGQNEYDVFYPSGIRTIPPYMVSEDLMDTYERSSDEDNYLDLRARLYYYNEAFFDMSTFRPIISPKFGWKGGFTTDYQSVGKGIRTAEVYLNRAEAYIRKFLQTGEPDFREKALDDLNAIRLNRYDTRNVPYEPVSITDGEELLKFYWAERRRELSFEDHRWFDLRRMGMPRIEHKYFVNPDNVQTFVLEEKSPRYVLPIPQAAIERNPALVQNP